MLSFWEINMYKSADFAVVGAGIMGCSVAFELRQKFPHAKIIVLERGTFPNGASTKNAGFLCFGSPTEILYDMNLMGEQQAVELVEQRYEGCQLLHERLGNDKMDVTAFGGYELLLKELRPTLSKEEIQHLNEKLRPVFKFPVFSDVSDEIRMYGFSENVSQLLYCATEMQIDSGKTMLNYWKLLIENNIQILSGANVQHISENKIEVYSETNGSFRITADKIMLCTNAFIKELFPDEAVLPGRGQVIITSEIDGLTLKGSFHFDEGFYYFRNVGNRVLFGGGRNLDFENEQTTDFTVNEMIVQELEMKLRNMILPGTPFEIEHTWQGIMGFSPDKRPVVKKLSDYTQYIMSCNGMGVALSPLIAKQAVNA
ncbi:MAG: FAD-binding oxidoreductase [Sphingobacteriales bacterium]|nr:FAD-binding oxidoreductase [Sphingobacteriales bacterium]